MPERIKITVRASSGHQGILTIEDAMRQVLDFFDMLDRAPGVEWQLTSAKTNSPVLRIEAEAISLQPSVDVSVVARAQKQSLARNLREITQGKIPLDPEFRVKPAKRFLNRNLNGVGLTEIDFDMGDVPVEVTPTVAQAAIDVIEGRPTVIYDIPSARHEIGSLEGTLQDVGTHYNFPAVRIIEHKGKIPIWCRLSVELQAEFQDKATYADVWQHRRVIVRGQLRYGAEGDLEWMFATDIRRIESRDVPLSALKDPKFTSGLSVSEYLDRFRDGTLGG